jgi:hypothetical protein
LLAVNNDTRPYAGSPLVFDALCPILKVLGALTPGGLPGLVLGPFTGGSAAAMPSAAELRAKLKPEDLRKLDQYMTVLSGKQPVAGIQGVEHLSPRPEDKHSKPTHKAGR